ncbi:TIGR03745 family integrating conjugative element membrane protein [Halorhodospira abdelmalekii]|nr:TIGR03745 family integrating conjugative element membrane protein [Halorhodospira abdelmalekii]
MAQEGSLPSPAEPEHGHGQADEDWLATMEGYLFDGAVVLATVVSIAGFVWVAWAGLTKFNEARNGRAEWGEVGLLGIAGGALLLVITFLLTTATEDVIDAGMT